LEQEEEVSISEVLKELDIRIHSQEEEEGSIYPE